MATSKHNQIKKLDKSVAAKSTQAEKSGGFSEEERAAMQERLQEIKSSVDEKHKVSPPQEVVAKIAEMPEPDRTIASRLHELIQTNAPELSAKLWYGMPAYAKDGKVVCFFQGSGKFKTRYSTLGFNDSARLDDGDFWPVAYAIKSLTASIEHQIIALLTKAVS